MHHFLLIYDQKRQMLVETRQFAKGEEKEATAAYQDAEAAHRGSPDIEIVLIGADRLETIMETHGHYFDGTSVVSKYLTGV